MTIYIIQEEHDGLVDVPELFSSPQRALKEYLTRASDYYEKEFKSFEEAFDYVSVHWGPWGIRYYIEEVKDVL
jgi:hypothetical protein